MKIFVYYIGKQRDEHANAMAEEYVKRCGRYGDCEMREINPLKFDAWEKHPSASKVLLDPEGKRLTSFEFSEFISKAEQQARDLVFIMGGAEGYPAGWRNRADTLLSLSQMTFPHEFARVMITEQIYRAFTILRGHPYAK